MHIDANTQTYCIFGNPVRHSFSPAIHNAAFRELGINALYSAFEIESIGKGVDAMRALGIKGASVTIPFKRDVMQYIDEIDDTAGRIGSVNTLVNTDQGIRGYNTDGEGALMALESAGIHARGSRVLIIGNGGSARAVAFTLANSGAGIVICGRNRERVTALVEDMRKEHAGAEGMTLDRLDPEFMKGIDIIINTTPVGMYPDTDACPIDTKLVMERHAVFDIIYRPAQTQLLADALKKGCTTVMGSAMLLYQGVRQFEIWTGMKAPVNLMSEILENELARDRD